MEEKVKQHGSIQVQRHSSKVLDMVREIVAESSSGKPVDSILRRYFLEKKGISRNISHLVKELTFQHLKWQGVLDGSIPGQKSFERIQILENNLLNDPLRFPDDLLLRTIPNWVSDCVEISSDWLRFIQTKPHLWIRVRNQNDLVDVQEELGDDFIRLNEMELPISKNQKTLWDQLICWPEIHLYKGEKDLFRTRSFQSGMIEIQDISSQIVSRLANPKPSELWWDTCSGEGGKTLHMCQLMQAKGMVMATDRALWRLKNLKKRASRAKTFNYQFQHWNGLHHSNPGGKKRYHGILIDAPCSGIGTWQRNPDGRWRTSQEMVDEMHRTQLELIRKVWPSLKPGGRLIYAVCTMTRQETLDIISSVSNSVPELSPLKWDWCSDHFFQLWPQQIEGNGMFIAQWKRT